MSFIGQVTRGLKWHMLRDVEGNYPDGVMNNPTRKADLDMYLEYSKGKNPREVQEALLRLRNERRRGKKRQEYKKAEEKVLKMFNLEKTFNSKGDFTGLKPKETPVPEINKKKVK